MKRRHMLQRAALLGASSLLSVGGHACWAWRGMTQAFGQSLGPSSAHPPRLIVVFLRGAIDGLNVVIPYTSADYYEARPTIGIAPPDQPGGALDLDGSFGLHPALEPLMAQWQAGHLAFIHAAGSPEPSRSHFQAQDYLELGTPGIHTTADGWLNRLLTFLPDGPPTQAVNLSRNIPLIFSGSEAVASIDTGHGGNRPLAIDRPRIQASFDQLYAADRRLSEIYQIGRTARETLLSQLDDEMMAASRGAPNPNQFATRARYLARLMVNDPRTQLAFMELGGWDTHVNEPSILNRHLGLLGQGLAVLAEALGPVYEQTTIVVLSEFGRTVAENGNNGTDHGHGNIMGLMGGPVKGGKVYGDWPGLAPEDLYQNRDLAVTTDFRDVLMPVLKQQFNLSTGQLAQIFPDYRLQQNLRLI